MDSKSEDLRLLRKRVEDLEEFHRFAESLLSHHTVYETLDLVAEWCVRVAHADNAAVLLFKASSPESVRTLARSADRHEGGIDHGINVVAAGWVRAHDKPLVTPDVLRDLAIAPPTDRQKTFGPLLAVPLSGGESMIGVLNLTKRAGSIPFSEDDLRLVANMAPLAARSIERVRAFERLSLDHARLRASTTRIHDARWIPSVNPEMQEITDRIARVAPSQATVLLTGETGTGKELVAWAIHLQSPRAEKPFVALNCGAIPATLADAELFGFERGAFTGAEAAKPGTFELANGGTLFLDEISAMPVDLQPRLLRVLEERRFNRIGSSHPVTVDIRVIAATNKDLEAQVRLGAFREDLFHRLNVFPLHLPPLRERREDIPVLAIEFLSEFSGRRSTFSPDALKTLQEMPWPGNVRELRNLVERISILCCSGEISRNELLRASVGTSAEPLSDFGTLIKQALAGKPDSVNLLEATEKQLIDAALEKASGNITKAAQILGLGRIALHRRLKKFRIADNKRP